MKTSLLLTILLLVNNNLGHSIQPETTFPFSVDLETIDGQIINSSTFLNDRQILVIDFWNFSCGPCIKTFNSIRDNFDEWNLKTDTKIIAIAAQSRDERTLNLIKKSNWPFEVYFDPDYNLFRALSKYHKKGEIVYVFPTMFLFDKEYILLDKLEGAKQKLKDGAKFPPKDETLKEDIFDINMDFYYEFFKGLKEKK